MAQTGSSFLLKRGDGGGPEVFTTIAGLRSTSFTISGETVDVTNKLSTGGQRELLAGAGTSSMSISGSGVFQADTDVIAMRQAVFDRTISRYQIVFTDGTYEGDFQVTSVEQSGEHNGEVTYSVSLESSGQVDFT